MNQQQISRRKVFQFFAASAGLSVLPRFVRSAQPAPYHDDFIYCLNTATIRGHKLGMMRELEIIARAGYQGAEIWMDTLAEYLESGGSAGALKKKITDLGISIENAIGFAEWIVDEDDRRKRGLEQLKKEMDLLAAIGCKRTAAPPAGATETPGLNLKKAAERYRTILDLGEQTGVVPHLELWGFSANLNKISDVLYVAAESGHPSARVLLDNYHLYKGGSEPASLQLMNNRAMEVFHMNDYPDIPRKTITDADRTLPGDGISSLTKVLSGFRDPARKLVLSVEIFNKTYYSQDALSVAKLALEKMKRSTENI